MVREDGESDVGIDVCGDLQGPFLCFISEEVGYVSYRFMNVAFAGLDLKLTGFDLLVVEYVVDDVHEG